LNYSKVLLVVLAGAGLAIGSCSHPSGTGTTGTGGSNGSGGSGNCPVGSVGCPCIGTTCDQDLVCADLGGGQTQCVTTSGSTGGAPGTGGSVATGGTPGTGGTGAGTGGSSATGGSSGTGGNATGTGGNPATGGSPGTGGNPANNLLANGDFSQGATNWHFESGTANVNNGQYCETNLSGSSPLFGWQNMSTPLVLSNGQSYTLAYQAMGSNSAALHIKVAHAVSPYTPDDYETSSDDKLSGSLQTFTHTFTPTSGNDDNTGVAFFVTGGQNICIANVSLVAN
jgi:hypothetical protein